MVECGGLENRFPPIGGTGVRIPLSPQSQNKPRDQRGCLFYEAPKKTCFLKVLKENKHNPSGFILVLQDTWKGIIESNPPLSAKLH